MQAELAALNYKKTRLIRTRGPGGRYTFGESGRSRKCPWVSTSVQLDDLSVHEYSFAWLIENEPDPNS